MIITEYRIEIRETENADWESVPGAIYRVEQFDKVLAHATTLWSTHRAAFVRVLEEEYEYTGSATVWEDGKRLS